MAIQTHLLAGQNGAIGQIILDKPKALNALSTEMIEQMQLILEEWKTDPHVSAVWIEGAGDKAFCAGGDVVMLYHSMQETAPGEVPKRAAEFFAKEYVLDYTIHTFPKPVVIWADGIVMGGGLGVAVGGTHRIVTERTMMAMPEVTIGLYPDVGASWFFQRMPGRVAEFLGMTGARLNAADAIFTKIADCYVPSERKEQLIEALCAADSVSENNRVREIIDGVGVGSRMQSSIISENFDLINNLMNGYEVSDVVNNFKSLETEEKWLAMAKKSILGGSPMTLMLVAEQLRRGKHLSLKQVFQMELIMSTRCAMTADLQEGIRALLIDKTGNPQWSYNCVEDISSQDIALFFDAPWEGSHPLNNL